MMKIDDATPVIFLGNSWFANTQNSDRDASWFASPCPRSCKVSVVFGSNISQAPGVNMWTDTSKEWK